MIAPVGPLTQVAPDVSDAELFLHFRAGDEAAFELLYHRYAGRLTTYAARLLGRVQAAEDVTTEAFVRLVDGRARLPPRGSLRAYLFKVTHRLCLDRIRSWKRRGRILAWLRHGPPAELPSSHDLLVLGERDAELQRAVGGLAPHHRAVVLLTYAEELSSPEVAAILGCTDQQVRSRLAYARRLLRRELEDPHGPR